MPGTVILARWIAIPMAVSAIVFAIAVTVESRASPEGAVSAVTAAGGGAGEAAEHNEANEAAPHHDEASEQFLGINLESPIVVWGFVVVSLLLALAVRQMWWPAFTLTAIIAALATVLDIREVINQLGVAPLIAVLAILIALAHAAALVLSVVVIGRGRSEITAA